MKIFSWNHFGCQTDLITQELFMETAKAMVFISEK